jgi:RES domain-containing protein
MEVTERVGTYFGIADPSWDAPLGGSHPMRFGGRWNAPGGFPVIYLCPDIATARASARYLLAEKLGGQAFGAMDLDRSELPTLISVDIPRGEYLDAVSPSGCLGNGLPPPSDSLQRRLGWADCRRVAQQAWDQGLAGIAWLCGSEGAPPGSEELLWFDRHYVRLTPERTQVFEDWYGPIDW